MSTGKQAILQFFRQFLDMPGGADIEVRGRHIAGDPESRWLVLSVSCAGCETAEIQMTLRGAREFAGIVEQTLRRFPDVPGLDNLILALREGADRMERTP